MPSPPPSLLTRLRAQLRWHRRSIAAAIAVIALLTAARSITDGTTSTTTVLVAARELAAGERIEPADLRPAELASAHVPDGAFTTPEGPAGRLVTLPVLRGEVLTDVRVLGPGLVDALGPGSVAAPVHLADDAATSLVRVGDVVDVLAAGETGSAVAVATGARVLVAPSRPAASIGPSGGTAPVVVLAVTSTTARALARAAVTSRISLVLRPG